MSFASEALETVGDDAEDVEPARSDSSAPARPLWMSSTRKGGDASRNGTGTCIAFLTLSDHMATNVVTAFAMPMMFACDPSDRISRSTYADRFRFDFQRRYRDLAAGSSRPKVPGLGMRESMIEILVSQVNAILRLVGSTNMAIREIQLKPGESRDLPLMGMPSDAVALLGYVPTQTGAKAAVISRRVIGRLASDILNLAKVRLQAWYDANHEAGVQLEAPARLEVAHKYAQVRLAAARRMLSTELPKSMDDTVMRAVAEHNARALEPAHFEKLMDVFAQVCGSISTMFENLPLPID